MALIEKLNAIGDAIRAKNGATEKYTLDGMVTAIGAIESGGGSGGDLPEEALIIKDDCSYRFSKSGWNWFIEKYGDRITTYNINQTTRMFDNNTNITEIPFTFVFKTTSATNGVSMDSMFLLCYNLENLPDIENEVYTSTMAQIFSGCRKIKEIPESWINNIKLDYINTKASTGLNGMFNGCYMLENIPSSFLNKLHFKETHTYQSNTVFYNGFMGCQSIRNIQGLPVTGVYTTNAFYRTFDDTHSLKMITFMTDSGKPIVAKWKNQSIDLTKYVGYAQTQYMMESQTNRTASDYITSGADLATYNEHIATHPNWYTDYVGFSAYNRDSAITTIQSLPDTSAYLATAGGTNTIKFKANQGGSAGKNISDLTAAQIAVATAKGWTVSIA